MSTFNVWNQEDTSAVLKLKVQSNVDCWKTRKILTKFNLRWNRDL